MIAFRGVSKQYQGHEGVAVTALDRLDLELAAGEVHCLIGSSGCGKTTALRLVNRLLEPDAGEVWVGGSAVATQDPVSLRRRIGYVIQQAGLFPHMTVAENIDLPCRLAGWAAPRRAARVGELLKLVGLEEEAFAGRRPAQLSGGQAQRVGVARALVLDPDYLLMDEPFGALDWLTRRRLRGDLGRLLAELDKTVLLVTHDLEEAFELGQRISIMDGGRLLQTGTPAELCAAPVDGFVAEFVGGLNPGAADG